MVFNIFNYKNIYEIVNYRKEIERFKEDILSCKDNLFLVVPEYDLCKHSTIVLSSSTLVNDREVKITYSKKLPGTSYRAKIYPLDAKEKALEIESTSISQLICSVNLLLPQIVNLQALDIIN